MVNFTSGKRTPDVFIIKEKDKDIMVVSGGSSSSVLCRKTILGPGRVATGDISDSGETLQLFPNSIY